MDGNSLRTRGIANFQRNYATKSLFSKRMRHALNIVMSVTVATLVGACSGSLPFRSNDDTQSAAAKVRDDRAYARSMRAARAAIDAGKPNRAPTVTALQIMNEWSTLPSRKSSYRRDRTLLASHTPNAIALPTVDYSMSIAEITANAVCHSCENKPYHEIVMEASELHDVPPALIHAVIQKESSYNPAATSRSHARGLMQVTPATGRFMGVANSKKLYDPKTNINAGTAYLKYLMGNYDTVDEVLAAYNAGPGNVSKYNGVPPFVETKRYVRDVKSYYASTSKRRQQ